MERNLYLHVYVYLESRRTVYLVSKRSRGFWIDERGAGRSIEIDGLVADVSVINAFLCMLGLTLRKMEMEEKREKHAATETGTCTCPASFLCFPNLHEGKVKIGVQINTV